MPTKSYFKGHGSEVMSDMQSRYGAKKGKQVFHATANKQSMKPKSKMPKGASQSPKGDIGMHRQAEAVKAGGFKSGKPACASYEFKRAK